MDVRSAATPSVLVTGGTGFLGRALVDRLVRDGTRVRVLGRRTVPSWRAHPLVDYVRGDVADATVVDSVLENVTAVYHLAAATRGDWATFRSATVDGTRNLLHTLVGRGGGRVVLVSSLGNYDGGMMRNGDVIDEEFPLEQRTTGRGSYARAKVEAEQLAHAYFSEDCVRLTIVRPGVIYGPGVKNPLAGVAFSIAGLLWVIPGSGRKRVPLVYLDDVVEALVRIMENTATIGKIYNIVHPELPTQNEYLARYRRVAHARGLVVRFPLGLLLPVLKVGERLVPRLRERQLVYKAVRILRHVTYVGDALKRDVGFVPAIGIADGIGRMLEAGR
jgi:nucleoside-diphosphate-sugar epimerase